MSGFSRPTGCRTRQFAAWGLLLSIGGYAYLGAQPIAGGFLGAYDKVGHLGAYGVFAALLWLAAGGRRPLILLCAVALLGVADECYQSLLPGRVADVSDFVTDVAAGGFALLLTARIPHRLRTRLFSRTPWNH